jgi:P-type Ca2+ transporter type 2C
MTVFVIAHINYTPQVANTMVFLTINIMQLLHMLNVKSHQSIFKSNPFENKLFLVALLGGIALTLFIALVSPIAGMFGLVPLTAKQWGIVICFAIAILPIVEVVKFIHNNILSK